MIFAPRQKLTPTPPITSFQPGAASLRSLPRADVFRPFRTHGFFCFNIDAKSLNDKAFEKSAKFYKPRSTLEVDDWIRKSGTQI